MGIQVMFSWEGKKLCNIVPLRKCPDMAVLTLRVFRLYNKPFRTLTSIRQISETVKDIPYAATCTWLTDEEVWTYTLDPELLVKVVVSSPQANLPTEDVADFSTFSIARYQASSAQLP